MPVTTRNITFLVGDPYEPSFATVTGRGDNPTYKWVFFTPGKPIYFRPFIEVILGRDRPCRSLQEKGGSKWTSKWIYIYISHRIHGTGIKKKLQLVDFLMANDSVDVGKYTSPMGAMGIICDFTSHPVIQLISMGSG